MKKYRVTVNGTAYEIQLEELTGAAPAASAPAAAPAPADARLFLLVEHGPGHHRQCRHPAEAISRGLRPQSPAAAGAEGADHRPPSSPSARRASSRNFPKAEGTASASSPALSTQAAPGSSPRTVSR